MSHRPRILVTTASRPRPEGLQRLDVVGGLNYAEAVARAGGLPLFVPNLDAELAEAYLDIADGLLLAGGCDVDPALFGQAPARHLGMVEWRRDALELALYRGARARALPVLGVCRGIQVINVAEGGSLHQHVPDLPHALQHDQADNSGAPLHPVILDPDSRLAAAFGSERIRTNSFHHQAVDRLGTNLRVTGRSEDNLIEAIEGTSGPFLLGVQWHPEMSFERFPEQFTPFALFLDALRDRPAAPDRADPPLPAPA